MTRRHIHRTKQGVSTISQVSQPSSSQVQRNILQRVIEHPTEENLTPSVIQQLQTTHGNQVVNRLVQQAKQNSKQTDPSTPTINQTTQDTETVQRQYPPNNDNEAKKRNKGFERKQEGIPLVKAFDAVYKFLNNQNKFNSKFLAWITQNKKSTGFFGKRKRERFAGYLTPDHVLKRGNKSDISELLEVAIKGHCHEAVLFQQAVVKFKQNPSADGFHDIMEKFIYRDGKSHVNISGIDRDGLVERAYRMIENELDDNGNPQVDTLFSGDHMTQNRLLTHQNNN